jgi:hypothetical protein
LEDSSIHSDSLAHYGGNDMNPPSLLTMRNMVGISVINACRGALMMADADIPAEE